MDDLLDTMHKTGVDFTQTFRLLRFAIMYIKLQIAHALQLFLMFSILVFFRRVHEAEGDFLTKITAMCANLDVCFIRDSVF